MFVLLYLCVKLQDWISPSQEDVNVWLNTDFYQKNEKDYVYNNQLDALFIVSLLN
jgi:hypothetical protein